MTLEELYASVPVANHSNIIVVDRRVLYDTGLSIVEFTLTQDNELKPVSQAAKDALAAL